MYSQQQQTQAYPQINPQIPSQQQQQPQMQQIQPQMQSQIQPQIILPQQQQQQIQQQQQQQQMPPQQIQPIQQNIPQMQPTVIPVPVQVQVQVPVQPLPVAESRPLLQNIVATANLGCKLDLKEIASRARNAEYNPRRFAAVIMRIRDPKTTALVFSSGKMVVTGAKSEAQSSDAAKKFSEIIRKIGFQVKFDDFKIQNMVGSCDVGFPVNLHDLHISDHSRFCTYEPELFPGLIYRKAEPKVVLLIFVSGKLVVTGAKKKADIDTAFDQMFHVLRGFRKKPSN